MFFKTTVPVQGKSPNRQPNDAPPLEGNKWGNLSYKGNTPAAASEKKD
jgi:hypothetical protein